MVILGPIMAKMGHFLNTFSCRFNMVFHFCTRLGTPKTPPILDPFWDPFFGPYFKVLRIPTALSMLFAYVQIYRGPVRGQKWGHF